MKKHYKMPLIKKNILIITISILCLFSIYAQTKITSVTHDNTNYPLIGKHRTVPCSECHLNGQKKGTPTSCETCHWVRKQDDRYKLKLGIHCKDCHTPIDWKVIIPNSWNHQQETGYLLEGAHRILDCTQCHKENTFKSNSGDCLECHMQEYNKATDPNHLQGQFSTDCKLCHNMLAWKGITYNHTGFILSGSHKTISCMECHKNGVFFGLPQNCINCHLDEYNKTQNPNHKQIGYPTECDLCHGVNPIDWYGARVDHFRFWELKGVHSRLDCIRCHSKGYNITSDCITCHLDDYNNTKEPNHRDNGFYTDCSICHIEGAMSWSQVIFSHTFPIYSGKHQNNSCTDCHKTTNYFEFSCIDCHVHSKDIMDNRHQPINGYIYSSPACYSCHPNGLR